MERKKKDMTGSKETNIKKSDEIFNQIVGKRLKDLRTSKDLTQTQLGSMIDVTFQQIQKYERGTNGLSLRRAAMLCKALNVNIPYLISNVITEADQLRNVAAPSDSTTTEVNDVECN